MTGNQEEQHTGQELRQADKAQVQRPVRQLIDLPSNSHRLHHGGEHDQETSALIEQKIRISKSRAPGRKLFDRLHPPTLPEIWREDDAEDLPRGALACGYNREWRIRAELSSDTDYAFRTLRRLSIPPCQATPGFHWHHYGDFHCRSRRGRCLPGSGSCDQ